MGSRSNGLELTDEVKARVPRSLKNKLDRAARVRMAPISYIMREALVWFFRSGAMARKPRR